MAILSANKPKRTRVGIVGANPDRGWAAQAHIPALKSLPDDFEITALSTSRRESAEAASTRFGVPVAFDNHQDLVNSADVDVVAITVKVPHHFELATAALAAGKAVYCEWAARQRLTGGGEPGRTGEEERRPRRGGVTGALCAAGGVRPRPDRARVRRRGALHHVDWLGNGLGTDGGTVQRLHQRQEKRRDDALDRGRPRGRRPVPTASGRSENSRPP